ncbi:hypothetical protein YM304_12270 [Ilumatobacter coccineus YM16-304]|uniref:GGDEF domain-containing protein n=1 Tax=Ilumatobacter coccineus (strain NBRC 103263 / KCTC 29153 / YM16-304) TaxID=1313172 RepID=A0A6C7E4L2_ILUCY|nr:hypothetical protein YM304_12270 [Ilumatobacter coccineus YM16-304]
MKVLSSEELLARARSKAFGHDSELNDLITAALDATDDSHEIGRLLVARALSLQGRGDATEPALAAQAAATHSRAAGDLPIAAFASSMAAVFLDQTGELHNAMEHAVDALIMLSDVEVDEVEAVRASLAVSGFFMRLGAFDLAVEVGRRAFDGACLVEGVPADLVAFSFGYIAAEGGHVTTDEQVRRFRLDHATDAASHLRDRGCDPVARDLLASGLFGEIDLANGVLPDSAGLAASEPLYDDAAPDLVAWHRSVRGMAALSNGDPMLAIELLDVAIPGLEASSDNHCLVRAIEQRGRAHAALGAFDDAYADASRLATMTRHWHLDQIGELAGQVARRAELERASSAWQHTAQKLADDIDSDPTTGVRSRRWLDRVLDEIEREDGTAWALMFDLDRFKIINDTYGHHVGDEVLARFGTLLHAAAGTSTAIARFGGEEFVVIIRSVAGDVEAGTNFAEQIRLSTATHDWESIAPGIDLTVSCGVASGPRSEIKQLLVSADDALLDAKRLGRNRVSHAADTLDRAEIRWPAPAPT